MDSEIWKILISATTPILVFVFGYLILGRSERIRREIVNQYDFVNKWANDYYDACCDYMKAIERYLALLHFLNKLGDKNDELGLKIQDEINQLNIAIPEKQLRIKRLSVFAKINGEKLVAISEEIQTFLYLMVREKTGSLDKAIGLLNKFNEKSRLCHKEMMGIAQQGDTFEPASLAK